MDKIEEIKKLKELLDNGAITPEEFNSIKQEILEFKDVKTPSPQLINPSADTFQKIKKTSKNEQTNKEIEGTSEKEIKKTKSKKSGDSTNNSEIDDELEVLKKREDFLMERAEKKRNNFMTLQYLILALALTFSGNFLLWNIKELIPGGFGIILLFTTMIVIIWAMLSFRSRVGFVFLLPYIIYFIATYGFFLGVYEGNAPAGLFYIFWGAAIIFFLLEYFLTPKCPWCRKRLWMGSGWRDVRDSYEYIGTKEYEVKSKTGNVVGRFEGPVSRTSSYFIEHHICSYCRNSSQFDGKADYETNDPHPY